MSSKNNLSQAVQPSFKVCPEQHLEKPEDYTLLQTISKQKVSVYLAHSASQDFYYAVKVFPYIKDKMSPFYYNEKKFLGLKHPNVIAPIFNEDVKRCKKRSEEEYNASILFMEYAPYGMLYDFLMAKNVKANEKLARTMFKQIVSGLTYLHDEAGIAHLDLKLENVLIGNKYELKIIDFDLSARHDSKKLLSKGTRDFRAPELLKVKDNESIDLAKCDVYSAGVILFCLRNEGYLPFSEEDAEENPQSSLVKLRKSFQEKADKSAYWSTYLQLLKKKNDYFSSAFRQLIEGMLESNPRKRWSLKQVRESEWLAGPTYNKDQIKEFMDQVY
mmetsp:Transcript_91727/g.127367  ORF Transcript_91727/g.127367 Transcript_91727/m.127367 type:complete len:330 (-) Transcript_91727:116-1105(-)